MKRDFIIFILLFMGYQIGFSQGSLYKDAIKRGMNSTGSYVIDNSKKKAVTPDEMEEYLRERGYIVGKTTTQNENIFGNILTIVKNMEFVSKDNLSAYMFNSLNQTSYSYDQLTNTGTAFLASRREIRDSYGYAGIFYKTRYETAYTRLDNIKWSGGVKEGLINGKGAGIAKVDDDYFYISGQFSNGFPMADVVAIKHPSAIDNSSGTRTTYQAVTSATMIENPEITDGKLKQAINLQRTLWYEEDIAKIENAYQKAKALTGYDSNFYGDGFVENFIGAYEKLNYDPKNVLPKAREVRDVYIAFRAIRMGFRDRYYGSLPLIGRCWRDDLEKEDRGKLTNAINLAKVYQTGSKYGFGNLFAQLEKNLNKKKQDFEAKISSDADSYRAELRRSEAYHQQYKQEMCESCKVDGSKTTFPEGYVEGFHGIFINTPNTSKEDGKIVLKNGNTTKWRYVYRSNGSLDYIEAEGGVLLYDKFDSIAEMVEKILQRCKELYCK